MSAAAIRPFGEIAAGLAAQGYPTERGRRRPGGVHRTGRPVLRDSLEEGTFEDGLFFRRYARDEMDLIVRQTKALREEGKKLKREARRDPGRRLSLAERSIAALTDTCVWVVEELCRLAWRTGQVYPSYDRLAQDGRSRTQIVEAIKRLREAGLLIRQRRFARRPQEGRKDSYEQTSNVYRPTTPKRLLGFLPRWMRRPPVPVCEEQREAERREENGRMFAQLSCCELARASVASGPLADVLAALGAGLDLQEERVRDTSATSG